MLELKRCKTWGRMKRRIHQNVWGNWYGYEGNKRVAAFSEGPTCSAEQAAERWLKDGSQITTQFPFRLKYRKVFE
jgi:hypothetical protein